MDQMVFGDSPVAPDEDIRSLEDALRQCSEELDTIARDLGGIPTLNWKSASGRAFRARAVERQAALRSAAVHIEAALVSVGVHRSAVEALRLGRSGL